MADFRRPVTQIVLIFMLLGECWSFARAAPMPAAPVSARRPNVVMIVVDDLCRNAMACYGNPQVQTPHMDRLAATGILFKNAYCQIPLCNPSRASVLTGMRPDVTSVFDLSRHFRDQTASVVTLPQLLRQNGWNSVRAGKVFHYQVPADIGSNGLDDPISWHNVFNPRGRDVSDAELIINPTPSRPVSAALSWLPADGRDEEQTDGLIATQAIDFLKSVREGRTKKSPAAGTPAAPDPAAPFFLAVGFFRPHTPFVAPRKYFQLHPLDEIQLPDSPEDDRVDIPAAALAHNCRIPNYGLSTENCRQALQAYYAVVSFVDAQIGRVLDAVHQFGFEDDTIVLLWSDHGYHLGEHQGIWQKRTLFEESAGTPLIIRAPDRILTQLAAQVSENRRDGVRIRRAVEGRSSSGNGQICERIVELVDIYPTLAELCGIEPPGSLAGRSLVPLLRQPRSPWADMAVTQILRPGDGEPVMGRSLRTSRWRFTEWNEGEAGTELYDLWNDPREHRNLAADSEFRAIGASLRSQFTGRAGGKPPATPWDPARL